MSQLKVDSIIPTTGVPTGGGGGIVQVKNTTVTDTDTLSCTSAWVDSEIACSITPQSASNKILISMYDGPEQVKKFQDMIKQSGVPSDFVIRSFGEFNFFG